VSPRAFVRLEGAVYSVPCRWAGLDLISRVGPTTVTIIGRDGMRIVHGRKRFGAGDRLPPLPLALSPWQVADREKAGLGGRSPVSDRFIETYSQERAYEQSPGEESAVERSHFG
jgi:hypothetical protein